MTVHTRWIPTGLLLGFALAIQLPVWAAKHVEIRPSWAGFQAVELIEGNRVTRISPPLPANPNAKATLPQGTVFLMTAPPMPTGNLTGLIGRYNKNLVGMRAKDVANTIESLSASYNLDPRLMASLVAVESSFNPVAVSSSGAIGLGQLKPETAQWLGVMNPYDPVDNLTGVARYLRFLLDRYNGSVPHALAAYFQGQGTIDRNGIDEGAQHYISKVNRVLSQTN